LKTIRIKKQTYEELSEIRKKLSAGTRETKTFDQIIKMLIDCHKKDKDTIPSETVTTTSSIDLDQPPPSTLSRAPYENIRTSDVRVSE
jgi:hypothetical protein